MAIEIPRREGAGVATRPLGIPTLSAQAPAALFGGGRAAQEVSRQAGQLSRSLMGQALREKETFDGIAVDEAYSKLAAEETRMRWGSDKEKGWAVKKGKDAFGLPEEVMEEYDKISSELSVGLANERQRQAFRKRMLAHRGFLGTSIQTHLALQTVAYRKEVTKNTIEGTLNAIGHYYQESEWIMVSMEVLKNAVKKDVEASGGSPEMLKKRTDEVVSAAHARILDRMLVNEDEARAAQYLNAIRTELVGQDLIRAEASVMSAAKEKSLKEESQDQAMELKRKYPKERDAILQVREIEPQELQDMILFRLENLYKQDRRLLAQESEGRFEKAAKILTAGQGRARLQLPAPLYDGMTVRQQRLLESLANPKPSHDHKAYVEWMSLSPEEIRNMSGGKYLETVAAFDESHRSKADTRFQAARDAEQNPEVFSRIRSDEAFALGKLRFYGIGGIAENDRLTDVKADKDKSLAFGTIMDQWDEERKAHLEKPGTVLDDKTSDQLLSRVLRKHIQVTLHDPDAWFFDTEIKKFGDLTREELRRFELPFESIQPSDPWLAAIRKRLTDKAKPNYSDERARKMYQARLLDDDELYKRLSEEQD